MLNTLSKFVYLAKPNSFGDICEKLLSDPYFLFLVTVAIFFNRSKIHTTVLYRIPHGILIPSFVPIGQVVLEERSLEKMLTTTDDNGS